MDDLKLSANTVPVGSGRSPQRSNIFPKPGAGTRTATRVLRSLAGICVIAWAFRISGYVTFAGWAAIPIIGLGLTGLLVIAAAWLPDSVLGDRQRQVGWVALAAVIAGLAVWSYFQVFTVSDCGTDEIAFDQYAAQLALHGVNPYLRSMAPAFGLFHVPPDGYTFQLNGQPVTALSHPALAFEAYLPLLATGVTTQAAVWAEVVAWALGGVIMYATLPRNLAPLAVVVLSLDVYIGYAAAGVTDCLFVPLLIAAAVRWDQFPATRGPAAWRGPACMGLAMAVKQAPWLIFPFVLAGIVLESRYDNGMRQALRDGRRYAGIALAAFGVPNLPYLVGAPRAWLRGVLTPLTAHTVQAGRGLVSISLSLIGGGSLIAYDVAAVVILAGMLACYVTNYPALKRTAFLLPSVALFFADRSFGSYLVMLIPAAITAAATTSGVRAAVPLRRWRWPTLAAALASLAAVSVAVTSPSPLTMSIKSVHTTGQLAAVEQVTVTVTNNTDGSMRPAFAIEDGMSVTAFWQREQGPAVLGPHQQASYTIAAPDYFAMPAVQDGFQVLAFAGSPASVSRTAPYLAGTWRVILQPGAIDQTAAASQQIVIRADVVNRFGQPVRDANVPVYLRWVIYARHGLRYRLWHGEGFSYRHGLRYRLRHGKGFIDRGLARRPTVEALTNAAGVATFVIRLPAGGSTSVYFVASLIDPTCFHPYDYSPIRTVKLGS
jgi:uncharacterized membrane protein